VKGYCVNDVTEPKRGHKKNWTDDALAWTTDAGEFDREFTIENREWLRKDSGGKRIAPNPPPKKVGKVDPKTIALAAVSDVIDCGSWKNRRRASLLHRLRKPWIRKLLALRSDRGRQAKAREYESGQQGKPVVALSRLHG